ncbi:alkyl sulfatase C-terminal domain-containing protein [Streptomonospora wellingtoniae]|uniref:alkyl sulfatase C-terminal domain-containing protein n=1 Tax=Streptomonospora wellingtoniae TaxID=3075544 RepID=UPI0037DA3045
MLIHYPDPAGGTADLSVTLPLHRLAGVLATGDIDGVQHEGDAGVLRRLASVLDEPRPDFPIVTP